MREEIFEGMTFYGTVDFVRSEPNVPWRWSSPLEAAGYYHCLDWLDQFNKESSLQLLRCFRGQIFLF